MSYLSTEFREDALIITLNRPEQRNAFDAVLIEELIALLERAALQPQWRYLLLQGHGKHFSAGADLEWMRSMANASAETNRADALRLARLFRLFYEFPAPTLVRIHGAAMGGALGLIACADIAIASAETLFALSELRLGLAPAVISPYLLRAIGPRALQYLALTASVFKAETALRMGLVHDVVPTESLDTAVSQTIATLLQTAPQASRACKALLRLQTPAPDPALEEQAAQLIAQLRTQREGQEGLAAFFNQHPPAWQKKS